MDIVLQSQPLSEALMQQGSTRMESIEQWAAIEKKGGRTNYGWSAGQVLEAIAPRLCYGTPEWSHHVRNVLREQIASRLSLTADGEVSDQFAIIGQFASYARPVENARLPGDLDVEVDGFTSPTAAAAVFKKRVEAHNTALIGFDAVKLVRSRSIPSCVIHVDGHIGDLQFHNLHVDLNFNRSPRVGSTRRIEGIFTHSRLVDEGLLANAYHCLSDEQLLAKKLYGAVFLSATRPRDAIDLYVLTQDESVMGDIDGDLVLQALASKMVWDRDHCTYAQGITELPRAFTLDKEAMDNEIRKLGFASSVAEIEESLNSTLDAVLDGRCHGYRLRGRRWGYTEETTPPKTEAQELSLQFRGPYD